MSPNPAACRPVRPAAVVNAEIRALLIRTGGWLNAADRLVYETLIAEWADAVRAEDAGRPEVVEAA